MSDTTTNADPASVDFGTGTPLTRIVVPITLDHRFDRGVSVASRLAERWQLPIHLVTAQVATDDVPLGDIQHTLDLTEQRLLAAKPWLDVDDEALAAGEDPAAVIAETLTQGDLVVLATDAVGTGDRTMSFAQALAHEWSGPIVMIGPNARIDLAGGDVVVGVDGSTLAEQAVPMAVSLSLALESHPWVVQVSPASVTEHVVELRRRGVRVSEGAYVREVVERLGESRATWNVIHGDDPAVSLEAFAQDHNAAFLVMTTRGESGLGWPAFGSVCMRTVRSAKRPVVVSRPEMQPPRAVTA